MKDQSLSILISKESIKLLFNIFEKESIQVCIVGGSVRDALIGKKTTDIDIAANAIPDKIIEILKKNNLPYDDYAYRYGTITTYFDDMKFQITSLREDVNQLGRHSNIIYTNEWKKDAARRDFTINALYLSKNGNIKDFFNGKKDLSNNTIRFIGNIEDSIQEDFLRIYRYFRFLAFFEKPKLINGYEEVLLSYVEDSFNFLSNDLIRQEILKMFNSPFPLNSFYKNKKNTHKKPWVDLVKNYFIKTDYEIGINRCLNKIDLLLN